MSETEHSTKRDRKTPHGKDEVQTPSYAIAPLIPIMKARGFAVIWEPAAGKGNLVRALDSSGFLCVAHDITEGRDFLARESFWGVPFFEMILTNPPYSKKDEFLERCFELEKPFALLLPTESIGGIGRGKIFAQHGIEIIVPHQRIDFEMPNKPGGTAWFHTSWFTWGLEIGSALTFVDLPKPKKKQEHER